MGEATRRGIRPRVGSAPGTSRGALPRGSGCRGIGGVVFRSAAACGEAEANQVIAPLDHGARHARPLLVPDAQSLQVLDIVLFGRVVGGSIGLLHTMSALGRGNELSQALAFLRVDAALSELRDGAL